MPDRSWKYLSSREIADYRVLRIRQDRYLFQPTQQEADFVVCDSPDWTMVIPVTTDGQAVLIRQYRHGVREVVLEIPGGLLEPGESPEHAAIRELREETGYDCTFGPRAEPVAAEPFDEQRHAARRRGGRLPAAGRTGPRSAGSRLKSSCGRLRDPRDDRLGRALPRPSDRGVYAGGVCGECVRIDHRAGYAAIESFRRRNLRCQNPN